MVLLNRNLTYTQLVTKIYDATNLVMHRDNPFVQYIYQNGQTRTLIRITNHHVGITFRESRGKTSTAYFYINVNSDNEGDL